MTRILRPLASVGLVGLAMILGPTTADANGLGLFGPRQTTFISPVETVYAVPTATSFVVPTTSIVSTSYLVPTSSVVYTPARYTLAPTIYRPATTLVPTSYLVGGSILRPTRYLLGDVVSTSYLMPTTTIYASPILTPSRIVYDAPVIESVEPIYVDGPSATAQPAPSRTQAEPGLSLDRDRQRQAPPESGRGPALESRPIEPAPDASQPQRSQPVEPDPLSPPDLPAPSDDGSIDGIGPLPLPFDDLRESRRPAFEGGLPGSTLASAARAIQGRVREGQSGRPVAGAVVTFSNTLATFAERRAVTNDRGEFQLAEFLPDGDWSIVVSGAGEGAPTRTYPQITVMSGRIYDRSGRDYSKLVLDY